MRALLSIIGVYNYYPQLFDDFQLPAELNKQTLVDNLCMELGELNLLINEPQILRIAIGRWSASRVKVWQHLYETTQYEYNPIWNKDGVFKETEEAESVGTLDGRDRGNRSAYDSDTYQPFDETITDHDSTSRGKVTRTRTEQGNIGITSTQELIERERDVAQFNLYDQIIEEFKRRFCIMVY